jgi:hypothetical protein
MADILPYPNPTVKRRQCIATWLRLMAETKIRSADDELTEERLRAYEFELRDLPDERLDLALRRASEKCKFFPKPVEIRDFLVDPEGNARSYQRLCERYERAYIDGTIPKSLPSVLDTQPKVRGHRPSSRQESDVVKRALLEID